MTDGIPCARRFDDTQYDHDLQQARDQPKSPYQFKLRDEASSRVLREKGVTVSRDPFAAGGEQGAGDKIVVRQPCTYRWAISLRATSAFLPGQIFTDLSPSHTGMWTG